MAAFLNTETRRRGSGSSSSSTRSHTQFFGRGGAGNNAASHGSAIIDETDLSTPTLKSPFYTTGRGGSGNITKNKDPREARRAQDVEYEPSPLPTNSQHIGRGGAANVFTPNQTELEVINTENARRKSSIEREQRDFVARYGADHPKGLADRGKDWLKARVTKA